MQPPDKPKRRMVVYVSEETYASLQEIAALENRSVSNVAERKIIVGLRAGPDRTEPDLIKATPTRQDQTGQEDLKTSVIDVLDNLPVESLAHLAEKLARILDKTVPVQTEPNQTVPERTGPISISVQEFNFPITAEETEKKKKLVKDVATRLSEFVQKNQISQRGFRKKYGVDITSLRFWISGQRGMSFEMIERLEKIISSGPTIV